MRNLSILLILLLQNFGLSQYQQFTFLKGSRNTRDLGEIENSNDFSILNSPSARYWTSSTLFEEEKIFVHGGAGVLSPDTNKVDTYLGDIWIYDLKINKWKYVRSDISPGSHTSEFEEGNAIGTIVSHGTWNGINSGEEIIIFGGIQTVPERTSISNPPLVSNNLWIFSISKNQFKNVEYTINWADIINSYNSDPNVADVIAGRIHFPSVDLGNSVAVIGGQGANGYGSYGYLNDFFILDKTTMKWKCRNKGTTDTSSAVFGTTNVYSSQNSWTGTKNQAAIRINDEEVYLFGGYYLDYNEGLAHTKNQLWGFNLTSNEWKFISGDKLETVEQAQVEVFARYGTTNQYDVSNMIGARGDMNIHFLKESNELLVLGGFGYHSSANGYLNDVWKYDLTSNQWKFFSNDYSKSISLLPIFGDTGVFRSSNRYGSTMGYESHLVANNSELLVLFGHGLGNGDQSIGCLNTVWKMDLFHYCFEIAYNDPSVCSSQGECVNHNTCKCKEEEGFYGDECNVVSCFGELSNSSNVCNRNGFCRETELGSQCACFSSNEFLNPDCSVNEELETIVNNIWVMVLIPSIIVVSLVIFVVICVVAYFSIKRFYKIVKRIDKIDDIELILQEAEAEQKEKDEGILHPKIKVNKSLFEVNYKDITLKKMIGEGGSDCKIYLALYNGIDIAYKAYKCVYLFTNTVEFTEFEKEVELFSSINHPYCLPFYGACINPPKLGILMKFCSEGDLTGYLRKYKRKHKKSLPLIEKVRLLNQISNGMEFLHSKKLLHRDLKPENVLVDDNHNAQIMDYGLAKLRDNSEKTMTQRIGTSYYMSPEIITSSKYSFPADVYSFAILVLVVISEEAPYGKSNESDVLSGVAKNPKFRPPLDRKKFTDCLFLIDLIETNWDSDPKNRNTFSEICQILSNAEFSMKKTLEAGNFNGKEQTREEMEKRIKELENEVAKLKALKKKK